MELDIFNVEALLPAPRVPGRRRRRHCGVDALQSGKQAIARSFSRLRDIESVSKALQGTDVDLLDVREWFDELIAAKPQYAPFIGTCFK
jgi:hypothetical protein